MMSNLFTASSVTVGMCSFFSKNLSKIFSADGLNCCPIAYFFLTFHTLKTGNSNSYLCGFYFECVNNTLLTV